ncbi:MAG: Mur ligase family protein, partial [bacterium]|nr:Mur ligase family protein [bacterium]
MNYNQAIEYLFNLTRLGWRLGVDKILSLLNELDNPHEKYKVVHVAGTNGKGSTSSMLASILNSAGYNSGLFTSPHLVYVGERIKYNNIPINREELVDYISRLQPLIKKYNSTFFEALSAIALVYFADKKVDIAVIEVGLGGRLDATNVVRPVISIITNIDIDHVKQLGRTRRSIASEKAGIIKPDSICISNTKHKSAGDVFDQICKKVNVDHIQLSQLMKIDNVRLDENFTTLDLSVNGAFFPRLKIALIGEHQIENAATAVAAATVLNSKFIPINTQDIYNGLQNVIWPGRLQLLRSQPKIVADVAHNLNGFTVLKKAVRN